MEEVTATRGWSGNGADCVRAGTIELVDTETEQLAAEGFGAPPTEELRQRVLAVVEQVADQCGLTPAATSSATPAPTPQPGTGTAQPVTTPGSVAAPATSRP